MLLGIHCSVRNGYLAAVEEARVLDLKCFQMLPYKRNALVEGQKDIPAFNKARRDAGVKRLIIHSRYLPALATTNVEMRARSVAHLVVELALSQNLEANAYVLHIGAYAPGSTFEEGTALFVQSVAEARKTLGRGSDWLPLYIENVPGGGRRMGGTPKELAYLLAETRKVWPSTWLCIDTAHAWAAGVALAEFEAFGDDIRAWHINDTLAEFGSNLESHEHLGRGKIGEDALGGLLEKLAGTDAAVILETPKGGDFDRQNVEWALKRLS